MTDELTTLACIMMLKAASPYKDLPEDSIDLYEMALSDLDPVLLKAAIWKLITRPAEKAFFPSINEIRHAAAQLLTEAAGYPSPTEAWGIFQRSGLNAGGIVRLAALDTWGTEYAVKQRTNDTVHTDRARFIAAYEERLATRIQKAGEHPMIADTQEHIKALAEKLLIPADVGPGRLDENQFNDRRQFLLNQGGDYASNG